MLDTIDRIRISPAGATGGGHAALVVAGRAGEYTARLEGDPPAMAAGTLLDICYEELNELFRQQAEVIDESSDDAGDRLVRFRTRGAPVSLETRVCRRIGGIDGDVAVSVDGEAGCDVVDLSTTGLCCIATARHDPGDRVTVVLHHAGRAHAGQAIVRSVHPTDDGRHRYGLECTSERGSAELHKGLQITGMAIQRGQLRQRVSEV